MVLESLHFVGITEPKILQLRILIRIVLRIIEIS